MEEIVAAEEAGAAVEDTVVAEEAGAVEEAVAGRHKYRNP